MLSTCIGAAGSKNKITGHVGKCIGNNKENDGEVLAKQVISFVSFAEINSRSPDKGFNRFKNTKKNV